MKNRQVLIVNLRFFFGAEIAVLFWHMFDLDFPSKF